MLPLAMLLVFACEPQPAETLESPPQPNAIPSGEANVPEREVVFADGSAVIVEVVATPETRAQGLMFRPSLSPDRGMLFLFPADARHSFWMKNTLIDLDIIWLDEDRSVVHVERAVPPCQADPCDTFEPRGDAKFVLELRSGEVDAREVRLGDVLEFRGGIENIVPR